MRGLYSDKFKNRSLIFHNPHYGHGAHVPQSAMIVGDMKVVKDYDDDTFYCYNLTKDIGESKDLKHLQKSTAQKLNAKLEKYLNDVKASIPTKNRNYNPSAKQSRNRFITRFDKDGDAKVSESEFKGPSRRFKDIDKNGDGFVDESEAPNRGRK